MLLKRNGPVTSGLRMSEIETLTRQALADIAVHDAAGFAALTEKAMGALAASVCRPPAGGHVVL